MSPQRPSRSPLSIAVVLAVALVALVAGALWAYWTARARGEALPPTAEESGELPVLHTVPAFRLTSSDGMEVSLADLAGHPWVASFIFTSCAGVCPIMNSQLARLQESLPEGARIVSITVDPVHDTPEVLREYGERFGARPDRWLFLTGDPEAIYRLANDGFRVAVGELPDFDPETDDGPFFHSKHLILVDGEARIRAFYDGTDPGDLRRLSRDIHR